jgi:hypothetical protein
VVAKAESRTGGFLMSSHNSALAPPHVACRESGVPFCLEQMSINRAHHPGRHPVNEGIAAKGEDRRTRTLARCALLIARWLRSPSSQLSGDLCDRMM